MTEIDIKLLYKCVEIAHQAMEKGNHPFGALLVDKTGKILIKQGNNRLSAPALHAETQVMIEAGSKYLPEFLKDCSLYSNFEPCCMCTGAIYWTNVGRIVYGLSEKQLLEYTGNNEENPTLALSCREVIACGQKKIEVIGPTEDECLIKAIIKDHLNFWK